VPLCLRLGGGEFRVQSSDSRCRCFFFFFNDFYDYFYDYFFHYHYYYFYYYGQATTHSP